MARRPRAGEDQLELTGLGEESPPDSEAVGRRGADPVEGTTEKPAPVDDGSERRAPFAMGRMSSRTREVHLARGDDEGPIPGPWRLRAVVRSGPGSSSNSGSGNPPGPDTSANEGLAEDPQD